MLLIAPALLAASGRSGRSAPAVAPRTTLSADSARSLSDALGTTGQKSTRPAMLHGEDAQEDRTMETATAVHGPVRDLRKRVENGIESRRKRLGQEAEAHADAQKRFNRTPSYDARDEGVELPRPQLAHPQEEMPNSRRSSRTRTPPRFEEPPKFRGLEGGVALAPPPSAPSPPSPPDGTPSRPPPPPQPNVPPPPGGPPEYEFVGSGYCAVGYLRGHSDTESHGEYNGTLEIPLACRAKCDAEDDCTHVSFGASAICSRYGPAGACNLQNPQLPHYFTWKKVQTAGAAGPRGPVEAEGGEQGCKALDVRGFGERGFHVTGFPAHYSHLVRNWLPRLLVCQHEIPTACQPRLYVPDALRSLYEPLVRGVLPGASLTGELAGSQACNVQMAEEEYWQVLKDYQFGVPTSCSSADIVFVSQGSDLSKPKTDGRKNAAARRAPDRLANEDEAFAAVTKAALEAHASVERVLFEEYPFAQQLRKTCSTSIIVGQHGAGLLNILWSRRPRKVSLQLPIAQAHMEVRNGKDWFDGVFAAPKGVGNQESMGHKLRPDGALVVNPVSLAADVRSALDWLNATRLDDSAKAAVLHRRGAVLPIPYNPLNGTPAQTGPWDQVLPTGPAGHSVQMTDGANAAAAAAHAIATAAFRRSDWAANDNSPPPPLASQQTGWTAQDEIWWRFRPPSQPAPPPPAAEQAMAGEAQSLGGSPPPAAPPCQCQAVWSLPSAGASCVYQTGCPSPSCDGDAPWCLRLPSDACALPNGTFDYYRRDWFYCSPRAEDGAAGHAQAHGPAHGGQDRGEGMHDSSLFAP